MLVAEIAVVRASSFCRTLWFEVLHRRTLDHLAVDRVSGPVARAVPGSLGCVEGNEAADMATDGRNRVQRAVFLTERRDLRAVEIDDSAFTGREYGRGRRLQRLDTVTNEV